jgi:cysteine desulfurase/selenocysteine lyase
MMFNPEEIRPSFPGTHDKVFLDAACVSLAPLEAAEEIERFLVAAVRCPHDSATAHHLAMDAARDVARQEAARLLHAAPAEIALVENTTMGLNVALSAIPLGDGDNVVVCDTEFMQLVIPLVHLQQSRRIEIRRVPHRWGMISPGDFARVCDVRTAAILVSSVQWAHGWKVDLAALSEIAQTFGAWLVVDGIQHVGVSELDLSTLGVDLLACGGHKWLNAPFGCGFLFVNHRRLSQIEPATRGYLTLTPPTGGWGTYFSTPTITPFRDYEYVDDASKFETGGTANYPGAIGLGASLGLINRIGITEIEAYVRTLTRELIDCLRQEGLDVITPDDDSQRAGIVTFRISADPQEDSALVRFLAERGIYVSARYTAGVGGTRVSVHFYNTREDLIRLLDAIRAYRAGR